jgi:hypothetical protein
MRTETIVWTPLPNGLAGTDAVNLSIFVSPQLQSDEVANPTLEMFPDFATWPSTLLANGGISFAVTFGALPPVVVTPSLSSVLSEANWLAIFPDPSLVGVESYVPDNYSTTPIHSYSVNNVKSFVTNIYGTLGTSGLKPPVLTTGQGGFEPPSGNAGAGDTYTWLQNLTDCAMQGYYDNLPPGILGDSGFNSLGTYPADDDDRSCALYSSDIGAAKAFHVRPTPLLDANGNPVIFQPPIPILDFHKTVASFGSYPAVLRLFGLVIDLVVPLPAGPLPSPVNVTVAPMFDSAFTGLNSWNTVNVGMTTQCFLTKAEFRAVPAGPKDYYNGMLDLADTTRFSVNDLDTDGAAEQLWNLSLGLQNIESFTELKDEDGFDTGETEPGQTLALTVPALRTTGPSIVWSGWGTAPGGLNALAVRQQNITEQVGNWVTWYLHGGVDPGLPVLVAEDIIRGHRFDVLTLSEAIPRWRSLHERNGTYIFGTNSPVPLPAGAPTPGQDEGTSVPGATSAANTDLTPTPDDLWVHEGIVSWQGWSLAAPRPGPQIDPSDKVHDERLAAPSNATDPDTGYTNAQYAANFTVPPGSLPKLRYGDSYRYRARAVDLAGNSLPPSTLDASTATAPAIHYRYEPVASPVIAETNPLGPGEATVLLAILDYQVPAPGTNTINPNGRWLLPPKASEMLVELHGMLDGFNLGSLPNRNLPPNGNTDTYELLAGGGATPQRVDGTLADAGFSQDANNNNAWYLGLGANPKTPWLPDPLSRGVSLDFGAVVPTLRGWAGLPWPGGSPLLILLQDGTAVGHSYTPASAGAPATETVTLPPADVLDIAISSALTNPLTLGVWWWLEAQASTTIEKLELALAAERGQLWMLTPYRVLRCVHAVRVPLIGPTFNEPVVDRQYGWTFANIIDRAFILDAKSSVDVDCEAVWTDLVDDPSDPTNNPAATPPPSITSTGHVFKANVPDPSPLGADDHPMQVFPAATEFPVYIGPGVQHNIGDTKHHLVDYTSTATSRFTEFFTSSTQVTITNTSPVVIDALGLDPTRTVVVDSVDNETLEQGTDYILDPVGGTIALPSGSAHLNDQLDVTYVPADTTSGAAFPIHILSTVQPKPPKIVRVAPAWQNTPLDEIGTPYGIGSLVFNRDGGWVRVYIERPWFSSGNNELLGVVGLDAGQLSGNTGLPSDLSTAWVTTMGLDPISVSSLDTDFPIVPQSFANLADVPDPSPWRLPYSSPPTLPLVENGSNPSSTNVSIWPYEVNFDPVSNLWYADVNITFSNGVPDVEGDPPPGRFVRLAMVRFQPYSIETAEISKTVLASFCQPVPGRVVEVIGDTSDATDSSVFVNVTGPAYFGFRPPNDASFYQSSYDPPEYQHDLGNEYAPQPFSSLGDDTPSTSTIMVEIQVPIQSVDPSSPLTGDLGWVSYQNVDPNFPPVMLTANFDFYAPSTPHNTVRWELLDPENPTELQSIVLPFSLNGTTKMRLRISELDYYHYRDLGAPLEVNTGFRRPFVCLLPIN